MSTTDRLIGLYPGTFDPVTRGHEDLISRALTVVDALIVGVATDTDKRPLFSIDERVAMLTEVLGSDPRIRIESFEGLTVEFARSCGVNKHLAPEIEILFMAPDATHSFLSSSLVREVARLGGDVGTFVAPPVAKKLAVKFGGES